MTHGRATWPIVFDIAFWGPAVCELGQCNEHRDHNTVQLASTMRPTKSRCPAAAMSIEIFVKTLKGTSVTLTVSPLDTVSTVKKQIQKKEGASNLALWNKASVFLFSCVLPCCGQISLRTSSG